ncbi:MAG: AAA family ATPase, partial [Fimbriimonadaceae bacterium]
VNQLRIEGYRSIRELTLPLRQLNVIVGPNGCGKSNLYQSVSLLRAAAAGDLSRTLASEGGFPSALWAGDRSGGPVRMKLGVTIDDFDYDLELGLPQPGTAFELDPHIKSELIYQRVGSKKICWLDRGTNGCTLRDASGKRVPYPMALDHSESVLNQISDPHNFPILTSLRTSLLKWRFYHGFRSDAASPMRSPQVGVRTMAMSADGSDLAAALQTIAEIRPALILQNAVRDAFPNSHLSIRGNRGVFEVEMATQGIHRSLTAKELSDGTLRYLCLLAALLSPSPAPLLALNEPETSLHEDLLWPLARLIISCAEGSQIWLTTHSRTLTASIKEEPTAFVIDLEKVDGVTQRTGRPKGLIYSEDWDT